MLSADKVESKQLAAHPAIGVLTEAESLADSLAKAAGQVLPAGTQGGVQPAKAPAVESRTALIASLRHMTNIASDNHDEACVLYDLHFLVQDEKTGKPLAGIPYRLTLETGREIKGVTDRKGLTEVIGADSELIARLEVPYYGDSTSGSYAHNEHSAGGC